MTAEPITAQRSGSKKIGFVDHQQAKPANLCPPKLITHVQLRKLAEKIELKAGESRKISDYLSSSGCTDPILLASAMRIDKCIHESNLAMGINVQDDDGNYFDLFTPLWCCGSRLCSFCLSRMSRRNRKKLNAVLKRIMKKLPSGRKLYYIVLTQPDLALAGLPLSVQRSVMYEAHRLFYQTPYWEAISSGSAKSEEFTLGETKIKGVFHYHFNLLAVCSSLIEGFDFWEIREAWTECLKESFEMHDIEWIGACDDGLANVRVQVVDESNISKTVLELCKYCTKPQSWLKIPVDQLSDVLSNKRFWRMFELYGSFKTEAALIEKEKEIIQNLVNTQLNDKSTTSQMSYVHTDEITAEKTNKSLESETAVLKSGRRSWRDECLPRDKETVQQALERYQKTLEEQIKYAQIKRKFLLRQRFQLDFEFLPSPDGDVERRQMFLTFDRKSF